MSRDGRFQAVRAAGENLQIRTVYNSHFMLIFVVGPIQAASFYAFSAQRMRAVHVCQISSRGHVAARGEMWRYFFLKCRKHYYFILQSL
jgi:hypothetical protein